MNSSENTRKGLFTVIYPFMAFALNLTGLAKECFAVIFNFWISQGQKPVSVSLTTMQTITGGTRPAVVQAVHKLEKYKFLIAMRTPGKRTVYEVTIPEQVLTDFMQLYAPHEPVKEVTPLEYLQLTGPGKTCLLQNKKKAKCEPIISPLKVRPVGEIRSGGLKEA